MAIQDEMLKAIINEIDKIVEAAEEKILVDNEKAKLVAEMLTELSVNNLNADDLVNQYIAKIKNICSL
ncbi:MAG: hypothetical protein U0K66_08560 [Paludibacteraceae bacterium]|nr:hypothetical protein [Paludibacteraceae bacterium]